VGDRNNIPLIIYELNLSNEVAMKLTKIGLLTLTMLAMLTAAFAYDRTVLIENFTNWG